MLHWPLSSKNLLQFSPEEIDGFIANGDRHGPPRHFFSVTFQCEANGLQSLSRRNSLGRIETVAFACEGRFLSYGAEVLANERFKVLRVITRCEGFFARGLSGIFLGLSTHDELKANLPSSAIVMTLLFKLRSNF